MRYCDICGHEIPDAGRVYICPECQAEREAQRITRRGEEWATVLEEAGATLMLGNDEAKLRRSPHFQAVRDWQYGPRGLVMIGPTGVCKTRLAFWLLHREHMAGRRVGYLNAATFEARLNAASKAGYGGDGALLERWERVDILLIDDLGKGGIGDRREGAMFGLVDARAMAKRPIITTQNAGGEDIRGAMAGDRAEPFLRRLREFNEVISFQPRKK